MRHLFIFVFILIFCASANMAQAAMQDYPIAKLQALDKSTARTVTFEAKVGSTIEYGSLFIKIQACRKSDPLDKPESAAFIQAWEVPINADKSEWVFSGWMFASSPALSAMDHAVYDVWVLDCLSKVKEEDQAPKIERKKETADQGELEAVKDIPQSEIDQEDSTEEEIIEDSEAQIEDSPLNKTPALNEEATAQPIDNAVESVIEELQNNE